MKKILIIEDDLIIAAIYRNKMELAGYLVEVALDGEEGLEKLESFKPDLVQLDLMLPKVGGLEIIKRIRKQPDFSSLPIVVVANGYDVEMFREALEAGANQWVSKLNSSPKVSVDIVNQLLGMSEINPMAPIQEGQVGTSAPASDVVQELNDAQLLDIDMALPSQIRQQFVRHSPQIQADLRKRLQAIRRCTSDSERFLFLEELSHPVHFLTGYAGMTGFHRISHLAAAFEVMLQELQNKPKEITPSTLCTVAQAVDSLVVLLEEAPHSHGEFLPSALILAVDDEPISRRAISSALAKVNLKAVTVERPDLALKLLVENRFDLVFLDVGMPGMNGFELCRELRRIPANKSTPVVFVTVLSDFEGRATSKVSGGDDLIAKPFLLSELAVKALTCVVRINPR